MKRRIATSETKVCTPVVSPLQTGSGSSRTRSSRGKNSDAIPVQSSIINFNRSRVKKATTDKPETAVVSKAKRPPVAEVESQSERDVFARNFRTLRKEAGLSQRDIQKLTGIAQSHVSEIESAMHNICIETMVKLSKLVKRPIHELLKP